MAYSPARFEISTSNSSGGDAFTRKTLFDLGVKATQNDAQYPLHHVTYLGTKFEVASSNSLGGDAITRK